jgi:hypothetical protein
MEEGACGLLLAVSVLRRERIEEMMKGRRILRTCLVLLPRRAFWAGQIRQ